MNTAEPVGQNNEREKQRVLEMIARGAALAEVLEAITRLLEAQSPLLPAFYIRGHGLYAWGPTIEAAEYVTEACEFLLSCAWEELKLREGRR